MASTKPLVMIVEDDTDIAEDLVKIFENRGFDSKIASTPEKADEILNNGYKPLSVVILDVILQDKDAISVAKRVLSEFPETKLIISTAVSDYTYYKQLVSVGAKIFLKKPYEISDLDDVLKDC